MDKRLKVLMSAYACEPGRGSEPEVGWQWALQMARFHEVTVLTRANNRQVIEAALTRQEGPHPRFVYHDLPGWIRAWKRSALGVQVYYALWQRSLLRLARELHDRYLFDLCHHVTFGKLSVPSPLSKLSIPLIFGPVGGGESTPPGFRSGYSLAGKFAEGARDIARRIAFLNPSSRSLLTHTHTLIAATPQTAEWLKPISQRPVRLEPQCGMTELDLRQFAAFPIRRTGPFRLISIARLVHWKGIHLALRGFARFASKHPESEYWIVSSGPEEGRLRQMASELGVAEKVTFWGRLPRLSDVHGKLAEADVLVHPALHEAFGYACLEALAAGRPVICLDWGGPALQVTAQCGFALRVMTPGQVVGELARAMGQLASNPQLRLGMSEAARVQAREGFHWARKGVRMDQIYRQVTQGVRSSKGGESR
jgi:glycosyltransferase involved in cell wall biosynthesis